MSAFKLFAIVVVCSILWVCYSGPNVGECPEPTWEELYPTCEPSHEWFIKSIDMTLKCTREQFGLQPKPEDKHLPQCL